MPKGPMIAQTHCLITCATEQHQKKWSRVCLHRCRQAKRRQQSADNVQTNWFVRTCVQTMCRQTSLSESAQTMCRQTGLSAHVCGQTADKTRQTADKLVCLQFVWLCLQFVCSLSAVCLALSAVCPHTCADKPVCLHTVRTLVQTN